MSKKIITYSDIVNRGGLPRNLSSQRCVTRGGLDSFSNVVYKEQGANKTWQQLINEYEFSIKNVTNSLSVSKTNVTLIEGEKIQLTATYYTTEDVDGEYSTTETPVTDIAEWTSDNENVVTVYNGLIHAIAVGSTYVHVSYEGQEVEVRVTVESKPVITKSIYTLTCDNNSIYVGETVQCNCRLKYYENDILITDRDVTDECSWSVDPDYVGTIDDHGKFTGVSAGTCNISAWHYTDGPEEPISITVMGDHGNTPDIPEDIITCEFLISTNDSTSIYIGETVSFEAKLITKTNGIQTNEEVVTDYCTWHSNDYDIVNINGNIATGISSGNTEIYAIYNDGYSNNRITVYVNEPEDIITYELLISANESTSIYIDETVSFEAKLITKTNGIQTNEEVVTDYCTWHSSNYGIVDINGNIVTGISSGNTEIYAIYDSIYSNEITVYVSEPEETIQLDYISVNPSSVSEYEGETSTVIVTAYYTDGSNYNISDKVSVDIDDSQVCSYYNGTITHKNPGITTISFSYVEDAIERSTSIEVETLEIKLDYISVNPSSVSEYEGETSTVIVTAYYTDGRSSIITKNTLGSTSTIYSYSEGTIYHTSEGSDTLEISYSEEDITKTCTVDVTTLKKSDVITYDDFTVSIDNNEIYVKDSTSVSATIIKYINDIPEPNSIDVTSYCEWSSNDSSIASVSGSNVTGVASGSTSINGSYSNEYGNFNDSVSVTVNDKITYDMYLQPYNPFSIEVGNSRQVKAYWETWINGVHNNTKEVQNKSECEWSSNDSSIASVSSGNVTGISAGITTIKCTYSENGVTKSRSVSVTVTDPIPVLEYISIQPENISGVSGQTKNITVYAKYTNEDLKDVTDYCEFEIINSSSTGVAQYNGNGVVSLGVSGTATLHASFTDEYGNSDTAEALITTNPIQPGGLTADTYSITLTAVGDSETISLTGTLNNGSTVTGGNYFSYNITPSSFSDYVSVSISENKITVTGIKAPTSSDGYVGQITAEFTMNDATATCLISVYFVEEHIFTYKLKVTPEEDVNIKVGNTQSFKATYMTYVDNVYDSSKDKDVTSEATWNSGNNSIISVNKNVATGINEGSTEIIATYDGYTDSTTINVEAYKYLNVTANDVHREWVATSTSVTVDSSGDWEITDYPDWMSFSKYSGSGGGESIIAYMQQNDSRNYRVGSVTFECSGLTKTLNFSQDGAALQVITSDKTSISLNKYTNPSEDITITATWGNKDTEDVTSEVDATTKNGYCSYSNGTISYVSPGSDIVTILYTYNDGNTTTTRTLDISIDLSNEFYTYDLTSDVPTEIKLYQKATITEVLLRKLDGDGNVVESNNVINECTINWVNTSGCLRITNSNRSIEGISTGTAYCSIIYNSGDISKSLSIPVRVVN